MKDNNSGSFFEYPGEKLDCSWHHERFYLISWWNVERFAAAQFYHLARILETISNATSSNPMEGDWQKENSTHLKEVASACRGLGLLVSTKRADKISYSLASGWIKTEKELANNAEDLQEMIQIEMDNILFMTIPSKLAGYFSPIAGEPLFGREVLFKFQSAFQDINEAGRCLACGRNTACVFHLMRVVEIGLRAVAQKLRVPFSYSWGSYLRKIEEKIKQKSKTKGICWKKDEPFFAEAAAHLLSVKVAWRNPTMHVERDYTSEEAEEVFTSVKSFMKVLATRISDKHYHS
jgi:HEPN domain-containing protein